MKNPLFQQPYQKRAIRGGSWNFKWYNSRARGRVGNFPRFTYQYISFRLFQTKEKS